MILITGANGFLGRYLNQAFKDKPFKTIGLSGCNFNINLAQGVPQLIGKYKFVVHAAGKAHSVLKSQKEEKEFFNINYNGTKNLIAALEKTRYLPQKFIFISSVSVYGKEDGWLIDESHPLKGRTPYSESKILAEEFLLEWGSKNGVAITILRLPLLVGKNPPGNLGAMIKAIRKGYYFRIGDGNTRRSMVLAEDVGKLIVSDNLKAGIYNLTDGYHPAYKEIEEAIAKQLNRKIRTVPKGLINVACKIGDILSFFPINSYKFEKLTSSLTFSDQKARKELKWKPRSVIDGFEL